MKLRGGNVGGCERCVVECRQNYGQLPGSHKTLSNARHNYTRLNSPSSHSENIAVQSLQISTARHRGDLQHTAQFLLYSY